MNIFFEIPIRLSALTLVAMPAAIAPPACPTAEALMPAFVFTAARATPSDFASALSEAHVCAGFIAREGEAGRVTRAWRHDATEPARTLKEALGAFQSIHSDFEIRLVEGLFLIRDKRANVETRPLTARIPVFEVFNTRAIEALRQAVGRVIPGLPRRGGVVGSVLGRPEDPHPSEDDLLGPPVTLRLENVTLRDALVGIGRVSPGVVWMLTESPPGSDKTAVAYRLIAFLPHGVQQPIETQ